MGNTFLKGRGKFASGHHNRAISDDSKILLTDDMGFDGDKPAVEPTSRMLSWARNSALYRLEQRMMTEKQLRDAIMRKARERFETISPAQIKALGGNSRPQWKYPMRFEQFMPVAARNTRTRIATKAGAG